MKTKTILTPYFLDQPLSGLESILEPDWVINRENLPKTLTLARLSVLHESLARYVELAIATAEIPVSIAGDCCAAIGVLAGLNRAEIDPLLIWLDAHGDFNTWETSPSGFLGGMPLAMLAGLGEQALLEELELLPLSHDQIILTDARDLDPEEKGLVNGSGILHLEDPRSLLEIDLRTRPLWIHFDTDILDPEDVPAQNYPAPGGIRKEQLAKIFEFLAKTGRIAAVSLSSWAPDLPGADQSRQVSMELLDILVQGTS
jgi:arginase